MPSTLLLGAGCEGRSGRWMGARGALGRALPAHPAPRARTRASVAIVGRWGWGGGVGGGRRVALKNDLLDAIEGTGRGADCDEETAAEIDRLCKSLEKINPTRKPLASDLINGRWQLLYTTSASILGSNRPPFLRPSGPIFQTIDARTLKAKNQETFPFYNSVRADLTPASASLVKVQFKQFTIGGLLSVDAPESARGELDTTYLDEEMRIGRGDKGNLFVLVMEDSTETLG